MNLPSFTKNGVSDSFYNSFKPQLSGFRLWYQVYKICIHLFHSLLGIIRSLLLFYILLLTKVKKYLV